MNVKSYGVVRCYTCDTDITVKIQYYDWFGKDKKVRVVRCEKCNLKSYVKT